MFNKLLQNGIDEEIAYNRTNKLFHLIAEPTRTDGLVEVLAFFKDRQVPNSDTHIDVHKPSGLVVNRIFTISEIR